MNIENKIFELYWSWYEDYEPYLFFHENKTEAQFRNDVKKMLRKYGEEYLETTDGWAGASRWIEFIVPKMEELGYVSIKTISYGAFGSYIIDYKGKSRDTEKTEDNKRWESIVGKRLLQKAIKHNEKIDRGLWEDIEKRNKKKSEQANS